MTSESSPIFYKTSFTKQITCRLCCMLSTKRNRHFAILFGIYIERSLGFSNLKKNNYDLFYVVYSKNCPLCSGFFFCLLQRGVGKQKSKSKMLFLRFFCCIRQTGLLLHRWHLSLKLCQEWVSNNLMLSESVLKGTKSQVTDEDVYGSFWCFIVGGFDFRQFL